MLLLKYNRSRRIHLLNKGCWSDVAVLHNRLSFSSKPQDSIIFKIIWCVLLPQHSILHDLFTWKNSRHSKYCGTHCTCIAKYKQFYVFQFTDSENNDRLAQIAALWITKSIPREGLVPEPRTSLVCWTPSVLDGAGSIQSKPLEPPVEPECTLCRRKIFSFAF